LGDRISRLLTADGDEQIEAALLGVDLGQIDVEVADRVAGEALLGRLVAIDLRQPADSMSYQAAVQGRASEVRDGRLQAVKAVVQRQERVLCETRR
jgi:hypothetical protein